VIWERKKEERIAARAQIEDITVRNPALDPLDGQWRSCEGPACHHSCDKCCYKSGQLVCSRNEAWSKPRSPVTVANIEGLDNESSRAGCLSGNVCMDRVGQNLCSSENHLGSSERDNHIADSCQLPCYGLEQAGGPSQELARFSFLYGSMTIESTTFTSRSRSRCVENCYNSGQIESDVVGSAKTLGE
jgi:hypothetical protein